MTNNTNTTDAEVDKTMAVKVAQDVLERLTSNNNNPFQMAGGTFFELPIRKYEHLNCDLQTVLRDREKQDNNKPCIVCAIGALFYSHVFLHNK